MKKCSTRSWILKHLVWKWNIEFKTTIWTIQNVADWIALQTDSTSALPLATVSFNGTDELTVTSNFRRYELEINIQSTTSVDATIGCKDTGGVTVVEEVLQAYKVGDAPMLTPYTNITSANVLVELENVLKYQN